MILEIFAPTILRAVVTGPLIFHVGVTIALLGRLEKLTNGGGLLRVIRVPFGRSQ